MSPLSLYRKLFINRTTWVILSSLIVISIIYIYILNVKNGAVIVNRDLLSSNTQSQITHEIIIKGKLNQRKEVLKLDRESKIEKVFISKGALIKKGDTLLKFSTTNVDRESVGREIQMCEIINNLHISKMSLEQSLSIAYTQFVELNFILDRKFIDFEKKFKINTKQIVNSQEFEDSKLDIELLKKTKKELLNAYIEDSIKTCLQILSINESIEHINKNLSLFYNKNEFMYLKAIHDGQISDLKVKAGDLKTKNEYIGTINKTPLIYAEVGDRYIKMISVGQEAEVINNDMNYLLRVNTIDSKNNIITFVFEDIIPMKLNGIEIFDIRLKLNDKK